MSTALSAKETDRVEATEKMRADLAAVRQQMMDRLSSEAAAAEVSVMDAHTQQIATLKIELQRVAAVEATAMAESHRQALVSLHQEERAKALAGIEHTTQALREEQDRAVRKCREEAEAATQVASEAHRSELQARVLRSVLNAIHGGGRTVRSAWLAWRIFATKEEGAALQLAAEIEMTEATTKAEAKREEHHATELAVAVAAAEKAAATLRSAHAETTESLAQVKRESEEQCNMLEAEAVVEKMQAAKQVDDARASAAAKATAATTEYDDAITALKTQHASVLATVKADVESHAASLHDDHVRELEAAAGSHADALSALESTLRREHDNSVARDEEAHRVMLRNREDELQQIHDNAMSTALSAKETDRVEATEKMRADLAAVRQQMMDRQRETLTSQAAAADAAIADAHEREVAALREQIFSEASQVRATLYSSILFNVAKYIPYTYIPLLKSDIYNSQFRLSFCAVGVSACRGISDARRGNFCPATPARRVGRLRCYSITPGAGRSSR
jgi:hypothetical protein